MYHKQKQVEFVSGVRILIKISNKINVVTNQMKLQ